MPLLMWHFKKMLLHHFIGFSYAQIWHTTRLFFGLIRLCAALRLGGLCVLVGRVLVLVRVRIVSVRLGFLAFSNLKIETYTDT